MVSLLLFIILPYAARRRRPFGVLTVPDGVGADFSSFCFFWIEIDM